MSWALNRASLRPIGQDRRVEEDTANLDTGGFFIGDAFAKARWATSASEEREMEASRVGVRLLKSRKNFTLHTDTETSSGIAKLLS